MKYIHLETATSTNAVAAAMTSDEAPHGTVVSTHTQTAGRGQRGNGWESEPGKNLTFSLVLRHNRWPAAQQFQLSMAVSVALAEAVRSLAPDVDTLIKWPNDLYVANGKLCGILIENTLSGALISRSIVGIGLNVNQTQFTSNAPNPISLQQLTGRQYPLEQTLQHICRQIVDSVDNYAENPDVKTLMQRYHQLLWRNDGQQYRWLDVPTLRIYTGRLHRVHSDGHLEIHPADGSAPHLYTFKEVAAVLR